LPHSRQPVCATRTGIFFGGLPTHVLLATHVAPPASMFSMNSINGRLRNKAAPVDFHGSQLAGRYQLEGLRPMPSESLSITASTSCS
jgi:hypothetical protein